RHGCGARQPPHRAGIKQRYRFSPQLVAVTLDRIRVDCPTLDWPEASAARFVLEIGINVGATDEDRLARHLDDATTVAWPKAVDLARDESFHALAFTPCHSGKRGHLDAPCGPHLHRIVLATKFRQLVCEPRRE